MIFDDFDPNFRHREITKQYPPKPVRSLEASDGFLKCVAVNELSLCIELMLDFFEIEVELLLVVWSGSLFAGSLGFQ